jgi:hypothetical protein
VPDAFDVDTHTTVEMLNLNPRLALSIVQPGLAADLSWQVAAEVDHIFPQSTDRARFPDLVDDTGNLAYLGKLRNIGKNNQSPWAYFKDISEEETRYRLPRATLSSDR